MSIELKQTDLVATFSGDYLLDLLRDTNGFVPHLGEPQSDMWTRLGADYSEIRSLQHAKGAMRFIADQARLPLAAVQEVKVFTAPYDQLSFELILHKK